MTADFGGGCVQEARIVIEAAPDLTVRIQSPEGPDYACPESPLLLRAEVSDSTAVATYAWTGGANTAEVVITESGQYTLRVTDVYGCSWEDRFEVQPCPTIVFFDTLRVQVKAEETAELCLRLINPSQETATTVEVHIEGSPEPYFGSEDALRSVVFAPGETLQCLSYLPPRADEADSLTVYQLILQNAAGGNQAAIGEALRAELIIEAGIRCRVQQDSAAVNCALTDTTTIQTDVPLITTLKKDDSFWAGDFEVKVTQSTGNGTFNGKGIITVPYLQQVQINVILKNVRVNEECQMVAGEVKVEGVGAALISEELANALNDLLGALDGIDNVLGHLQNAMNVISTVVNGSSYMSSVLGSNWNVLQGAGPIYNEYPYLPDSLAPLINNAIWCYLANPPDTCNQLLANNLLLIHQAIHDLFKADYAVSFLPFTPATFGFDTLVHQAMYEKYNFFEIAGQRYFVPWASIAVDASDTVTINIPHDQLPDDLSFEDNQRNPIQIIVQDNSVLLPIRGRAQEGVHQLYAVQHQTDENGNPVKKYAGKLNILTYPRKTVQLELVPVNQSITISDSLRRHIEEVLQAVYESAVVQIQVTTGDNLQMPTLGNSLDTTGTGIFSTYNPEMRTLIDALQNRNGFSNEKYYLLVVGQFDDAAQEGFMPKGRKFGFVALQPHADNAHLIRTIAHELGHGSAVLNHTWEDFPALGIGQTDNLLDYSAGTRLHKYQWERIQHPPLHLAQLDGDEEGASVGNGFISARFVYNDDIYYRFDESETGYKTFLTPAGELYAVPARAVVAIHPAQHQWPAGCLVGFHLDDRIYLGYWDTDEELFHGYKSTHCIDHRPSDPVDDTNVHIATAQNCYAYLYKGVLSGYPTYMPDHLIVENLPEVQYSELVFSGPHKSLYCMGNDTSAWCGARYAGHPYLDENANDLISRYVKANPCAIEGLTRYDFSTPPPGGDDAYQDLANYVGILLGTTIIGVVAAPALLSIIFEGGSTATVTTLCANDLRRRAIDATTAYTIDATIQAAIHYIWPSPEEDISPWEAFRRVNQAAALFSAGEAAASVNQAWKVELIATSSSNCVVAGFFDDNGTLRDSFALRPCLVSATAAVITTGVMKKFPAAWSRLRSLSSAQFAKGIKKLHLEFPDVFNSIDLWAFFRGIKDNLHADDIAAMFDLPANTPELTAIAQNLSRPGQESELIHAVLGEANWWRHIPELIPNPALRAKFLQDISGNHTLAAALKAKPELVGAWEALINTELRDKTYWLENVSTWIDEGLELTSTTAKVSIKKAGVEVGEISGDLLRVRYSHYGGDLICHQSKTTTVIGKYELPNGEGTKQLIDSKLSKYGENPGGVNVLNDTRNMTGWPDQQIWDEVNKPWLDAAANRGDIIRAISDPSVTSNIYKTDGTLSFFGREHEYLTKPLSEGGLGYIYNPLTFSYIK